MSIARVGFILLVALAVGCAGGDVDATTQGKASKSPKSKSAKSKQKQNEQPAEPTAPAGMVWIPAGRFRMGDDAGERDQQPMHEVEIDGFWLDETEVTNAQFARFVAATNYVTVAERKPRPEDFPGVDPADLVPGALVFVSPGRDVGLGDATRWWEFREGASWRHPEGPESNIDTRADHPVVHVCWEDANAYAEWAQKRLPTEAEWEYAARAGGRSRYVWGDEQVPGGKWQANIWQGEFPVDDTGVDGFRGTAPVRTFAANRFGLFDMSGNVWEWCADFYHPGYYAQSPRRNPPGPDQSHDPDEPGVAKRVIRGGSFLCSDVYCTGYQPAVRMKSSPDTGLCNTGFRCAKSAPPK